MIFGVVVVSPSKMCYIVPVQVCVITEFRIDFYAEMRKLYAD